MDIMTTATVRGSCLDFAVANRDNGSEDAITAAKEMAENIGVEPVFKGTRIHWKRRQFGYQTEMR
ncbi:hypothetical protein KIL84_009133 [Mauremys mutica]|uniref:Uncharacterized protein n=1 Tax=Mauremys mutica TaxID=74926 RepID=A0A9D4AXN3_9SAUR|nr:hypothetical protein KIL84_009133 [Mauremys mutica]